jgi:hypothetical protein
MSSLYTPFPNILPSDPITSFSVVLAKYAQFTTNVHSLILSLSSIHLGIILNQEPCNYQNSLLSIAGYILILSQTYELNTIPYAGIHISFNFLRSFSFILLPIYKADLVGIIFTYHLPNSLLLCLFLSAYNCYIVGLGYLLTPYTNIFELTAPAWLIGGDSNLHSQIYNPKFSLSSRDLYKSAPFEATILEASFFLVSPIIIYICYLYSKDQPAILDFGYALLLLLLVI